MRFNWTSSSKYIQLQLPSKTRKLLLDFILIMIFSYSDKMVLTGWPPPSSLSAPAHSSNIFSLMTFWFSMLQDWCGTKYTEKGKINYTGMKQAAQHYSSGLRADPKCFQAFLQCIFQVSHASRSLYKMQPMLSIYCCGHCHKMCSGNSWECFIACP